MSRRTDLRTTLSDKLTSELGPLSNTTSEFVERYELTAEIGGKRISATVTRYPRGENPETYQGKEMWSVDLESDGAPVERPQNPQSSLQLAFDVIDWDRVRRSF